MKRLIWLGITAVIAGAAVAPLAGADRSGLCGQSGWATTAQGSRQLVSAGYYTWHNRQGWHLRLEGDARATLKGRVSADARLGISQATLALRRALKVQSRSFSFTLARSNGTEGIDFKAACASKLNFVFGA